MNSWADLYNLMNVSKLSPRRYSGNWPLVNSQRKSRQFKMRMIESKMKREMFKTKPFSIHYSRQ
jgi:hypothetical protein